MEICNLDDYLLEPEICVDIHSVRDDEEVGTWQVIRTTNELSLTKKMYSQSEIHELIASGKGDVIVAKTTDKSGEKRLISAIILKYGGDGSDIIDVVDIDQFLMNCHARDYKLEKPMIQETVKLEKLMIQETVKWLKKARPWIKRIRGHFTKTDKNKLLEKLYDDMGFIQVADGDLKMYEIRIEDIVRRIDS